MSVEDHPTIPPLFHRDMAHITIRIVMMLGGHLTQHIEMNLIPFQITLCIWMQMQKTGSHLVKSNTVQ
jgi:hypothetical protein